MKFSSALLSCVSAGVIGIISHRSEAGEANAADYRDHKRVMYYLDENKAEQPVKTAADWAIRRRHILAGMQLAMGNLPPRDPEKRVPIDVKILEGVQQEGITRLTISYVAEDEDRVTAYLYLPESKDSKKQERRPAMLALHPTGPLGKGIVAAIRKSVGLAPRPARPPPPPRPPRPPAPPSVTSCFRSPSTVTSSWCGSRAPPASSTLISYSPSNGK